LNEKFVRSTTVVENEMNEYAKEYAKKTHTRVESDCRLTKKKYSAICKKIFEMSKSNVNLIRFNNNKPSCKPNVSAAVHEYITETITKLFGMGVFASS